MKIIDANFNRVREALRVIEDILRFSKTDTELALKLREIRHAFTSSYIKYFGSLAIVSRNVKNDPGKENKPYTAKNIRQIVVRNFLRAEEGLRSIEECSIITSPSSTKAWQKLRFAIYQIEQQTLIKMPEISIQRPFFAICALPSQAECISTMALKHQIIMIVTPVGRIDNLVRTLKMIKKRNEKIILIVQDRPDIALAGAADGVHLEYGSISACDARKILPGRIIGITLGKNQKKLSISIKKAVDYIACKNISQVKRLLTKKEENGKLYTAIILNSCREIEKAIKCGTDGVIIGLNDVHDPKIGEIQKIIEYFYSFYGKKA
ncbi:MAG: thiamine phosphate synthase [Candidatus Omnitrophica bacterium]|nr:thiamine phosphate synthase [Candidatus Omnitrophota bacterium]